MSSAVGVTTWYLPQRGIEGLRWASEAGFSAAHFDKDDYSSIGAAAYADGAASLGIELIGAGVVELPIIGLDAPDAAAEAISAAIAMARALDVQLVYLPAFGDAEIRTSEDTTKFAALIRHAIAEADDAVEVAVETPVGVDALQNLFHAADSPRLRLLFDTQNPTFWGEETLPIIDALADRIAVVHVKDGRDGLGDCHLGDGSANVLDSLLRLAKCGYTGRFVIENEYRHADPTTASRDIAALESMWSTAVAESSSPHSP